MKAPALLTALGIAAALAAPPAQAHHAFAAEFDPTAPVTLKGSITQVEWVNPHVWIHMSTVETGGATKDWMIEAYTPNTLLREGLDRRTLATGAQITVRGYLARNRSCLNNPVTHAPTCKLDGRALALGDGKLVFIGTPGDGAPYDDTEPREEYDCFTAKFAAKTPTQGSFDSCISPDAHKQPPARP